jgi:hypothetical protein
MATNKAVGMIRLHSVAFRIVMLLVLVPLGFASAAQGREVKADPASYSFYPDSPLHLGGGFNPNDVAKVLPDCIQYTRIPLDGESGKAKNNPLTQTLVLNPEQLNQTLNMDAKLDASYLAFHGNASYNFVSDNLFSDSSLTVVISAYSDYGRVQAGTPVLRSQYIPLLADSKKFQETCGSRFVSVERRAASVSAIVTIYGLTKEDHDAVTSSLAAGGGWGPLSADASVRLSQDIKRSSQSDELSVQVVSTGGVGIQGIADGIKEVASSDDPIGAINRSLAQYIKGVSAVNAAPVSYQVTSMDFAGWQPDKIAPWTDHKEAIARDMVAAYRLASSEKDTAQGVLDGADPRRRFVRSNLDPVLRENIAEYSSRMGLIAAAWTKCKSDTTADGSGCVAPAFPEIASPIPKAPAPPTLFFVVEGPDSAGSYRKLNSVQTRAFMQNFVLAGWKDTFLPNDIGHNTVTATKLQDAIKNVGMAGGFLEVTVAGDGQFFQSLSVKAGGTQNYQDLRPLGSLCCNETFDFASSEWALVADYIRRDLGTLGGAGILDRSATFAIHVTDVLGRNYYLPFATAVWHRDQKPVPDGAGMFYSESVEIRPAL